MIDVSNADRIVFPELGRTKGEVVAYYDRVATRALPHVCERPLSIRRYPKGLAGPGFFQKNVPAHYPESIGRFEVPRSSAASKKHRDTARRAGGVTVYPVLHRPEQLSYLANQGAIELHVPTTRASAELRPDRLVIDLDRPAGALALVQRAAYLTRDALGELGLSSVPIATGSKGYHVVVALQPSVAADELAQIARKFATLLAAAHPDELTTVYRVDKRGGRVFLDWLRNNPIASVIAAYSLRATPRATVATPLAWAEVAHTRPDAFGIDDVDALLERPDSLAELAASPSDPQPFMAKIEDRFAQSGLALEPFDRFRA